MRRSITLFSLSALPVLHACARIKAMRISLKRLSLGGCLLLSLLLNGIAGHAEPYRMGEDYLQLVEPIDTGLSKKQVQVLEFFWYGCVHCFEMDKELNRWLLKKPKRVSFQRIPAVMRDEWLPHARAFYAAQRLGVLDAVHTPIFKAIHERKIPLNEEGSLVDFIAIKASLAPEDVGTQMDNILNRAAILQGIQLQKQYGLPGVPVVIVNGRYIVNGRLARGFPRMMKIVDFLVNKELVRTR